MADQEQLARLKRSVSEWNLWREQQPYYFHPDFTYADLVNTDLANANLIRAEFYEANLTNANLTNANLSFANLSFADLSFADLSGARLTDTGLGCANLNGARLTDAQLTGANLDHSTLNGTNLNRADLDRASLSANLNHADFGGANLGYATLTNADLRDTDFSGAHFHYTTFAWVDLSLVKGLETAIHDGPSIVDINTVIFPTHEHTCEHFLLGVGFTKTQVEYLPSLLTPRPIEYASLFISYAHQDDALAKRLYTDLRDNDVPCWFAPHDLRPGTPILRGIEEAIHLQEKFLLILSKHAVGSRWVEREVDAALHQEIKRGQDILFPIRLDNAVLESSAGWATRLQHRHIGDFTGWRDETFYQQAFTTLLRHLTVSKPPTP